MESLVSVKLLASIAAAGAEKLRFSGWVKNEEKVLTMLVA